MHRFWNDVIVPLLAAVHPQTVVEIGSSGGTHTRLLAEYCAERGISLHAIDPQPRFDPDELSSGSVRFHRERSLDALRRIGPVDVALIDGDHNWYTVYNELCLLADTSRAADRPLPVVVCHDVGWPYGRRDMYYEPGAIPPAFRQPWKREGLIEGQSELSTSSGLNPHLANAVVEGGPRNGVLTAIEDFVEESAEEYALAILPVIYGLAVLSPRTRLARTPGLAHALDRWGTPEGLAILANLADSERRRHEARLQTLAAMQRGSDRPVAAPAGRLGRTDIPPRLLAATQGGVMRTKYRGRAFLKSPFDAVLYLQLFQRLRPMTVIEIGTKDGGSALWFADALEAHGLQPSVITVDLREPPTFDDHRIRFVAGDANNLAEALTPQMLADLPRPWIVVEDSAHTYSACGAVLDFFHAHLLPGDYAVVEDGIVAHMTGERYAGYEDGPNRAVRDFMAQHPDDYAVDDELCDFYGYNATWATNGWLQRVQ
jgi:cephalosporin hydroxylase